MFPLKKEGMEIPANDLWFLLSVPWKAFSSILLRLKENWTVKQSRSPKALMSSRIRQVTWLAHIHSFCHWFEQPFRKIALWGGHTFISWLLMGAGSTSLCAGWGGGGGCGWKPGPSLCLLLNGCLFHKRVWRAPGCGLLLSNTASMFNIFIRVSVKALCGGLIKKHAIRGKSLS